MMRGCRETCLWFAGSMLLGFLLLSSTAFAQGLTFDDDEGLIFDDDDGFVFDDDEGLVFDDDELDFEFEDERTPGIGLPGLADPGAGGSDLLAPATVTTLVVPRGQVPAGVVDALTEALVTELGTLEHLTMRSNEDLREEFEIMGSELAFECAFDSVCLGGYGRRLGYDQIVMGRIEVEESGEWLLTLNLVGAAESSVLSFRTVRTEASVDAVRETLPRQVRALYGIRMDRRGPGQDVSSGRWQRGVAFGALAGSAVALGVGAYFGMQAASIQDDVRRTEEIDGVTVYSMDQRTARSEIDRGQQMASTANAFFAIGGGLALVSAVFFLVTPGADIDIEGDADFVTRDSLRPRWQPTVRGDGLGVRGSWRF